MTLSDEQRERWRAFVASGAPFAAYRQHNAPDARAETAEMLLAVAEHLAACERVVTAAREMALQPRQSWPKCQALVDALAALEAPDAHPRP